MQATTNKIEQTKSELEMLVEEQETARVAMRQAQEYYAEITARVKQKQLRLNGLVAVEQRIHRPPVKFFGILDAELLGEAEDLEVTG